MIVSFSKVKTYLSKLINLVCHGESLVIAKNNIPIADLVAHNHEGIRTLGLLTGEVDIPDCFNDENSEINEMFYGR